MQQISPLDHKTSVNRSLPAKSYGILVLVLLAGFGFATLMEYLVR